MLMHETLGYNLQEKLNWIVTVGMSWTFENIHLKEHSNLYDSMIQQNFSVSHYINFLEFLNVYIIAKKILVFLQKWTLEEKRCNCWKSLLFYKNKPWKKKDGDHNQQEWLWSLWRRWLNDTGVHKWPANRPAA